MYCTRCGIQIEETVNFCHTCGAETPRGTEARRAAGYSASRRLYRSTSDKKLGGVCAGLARYFEVDPTLIRLICAAAIFVSGGLVILAYIAAWIIVPLEPYYRVPYPAAGTSPQAAA